MVHDGVISVQTNSLGYWFDHPMGCCQVGETPAVKVAVAKAAVAAERKCAMGTGHAPNAV